ncbi:oxidoreductase [Trichophyton tonsurans CBS 112818]|uniref:uS12 prolyl 3,4-dihydroxylase n=1 Tax=Trichophyton tonsurans (strain CBS 112818) TaxID=647933 RepID=F2S907_TRIT1|nr:oxidoreductase [Trichophyton tonsurans CBS 112818]
MKRKADSEAQSPAENGDQLAKKRAISAQLVVPSFADGLLDKDTLEKYKAAYAKSGPYKHGVISPLFNQELLRAVRSEIQEHISFTEKETDIYKIYQSGDLANLDGLDDESLSRLPSLLKLRNALYSEPFREYLSEVTGAGKLSGSKTDMAVNVYTGGCHLLCHDDVIGSRRVSYILYLTDPDVPWKPEWGGALRLFPTTTETNADGEKVKIPKPDHTVSIPPAFNQLSFFAVQPGESFHDVEEVYHMETKGSEKEIKSRVRMAISGWFHIPQEGEDGYEEGLAEKLAERSSLQQLQGEGDEFDRPQPQFVPYNPVDEQDTSSKGKEPAKSGGEGNDGDDDEGFNDKDLDFLLKYIAPSYLTPDVASQLNEIFDNDRIVRLEKFLSDKFTPRLRSYIESQEKDETFPTSAEEIEQKTDWKVSRPPHKHRYLYQQPCLDKTGEGPKEKTPIQELLEDLLPSRAFKKWLSAVTGLDGLLGYNLLARRFRRGEDYTLASGYEGESPRLEFTIGITPTPGWEKEEEDEEEEEAGKADKTKSETSSKAKPENGAAEATAAEEEELAVGGYEIYMAGDDDDEEEEADAPAEQTLGSTGSKSKVNKSKADPAIYKSSTNDEDDGILFSMAAGWNRMSIVLRDQGPLKFVKYVSRAAKGDRWDITGEIDVEYDDEEEEDEEGDK